MLEKHKLQVLEEVCGLKTEAQIKDKYTEKIIIITESLIKPPFYVSRNSLSSHKYKLITVFLQNLQHKSHHLTHFVHLENTGPRNAIYQLASLTSHLFKPDWKNTSITWRSIKEAPGDLRG